MLEGSRFLLMTRILTAILWAAAVLGAAEPRSVPLIHTTDLFHPPMDPDDHIDLVTTFALDEFDLRAVLLDRAMSESEARLRAREPGFVPVLQLCFLTGRAMPVAAGPSTPLKSTGDAALDRPRSEQAAVELMLRALRESPSPAYVQVVGSARILMAAFNREPELLRRKVRAVLLNAGSSAENSMEWNVEIDRLAYVGLLRSGLNIDWYPCGGPGPNKVSAFNSSDRNTFWRIPHKTLFRGLPEPLLAWFVHGLTASSRGDILRALGEEGRGYAAHLVLNDTRNMWSTASMVLAAGRVLAKMPEGWRFVPAGQVPADARTMKLELEPVEVTVSEEGYTRWQPAQGPSHIRLFRRQAGPELDAAMAEALNALLGSLKVDPL